ncbi:MAG TPA: hypothetical protein VM285_16730 [Polyangia bacterium]|nr:hypothetical protein [Polyangia bacterium]
MVGIAGILLGVATAAAPEVGLLLAVGLLGVCALGLPVAAWAGASVALALGGRTLVAYGLLPEASVQLPIVMAWIALALALVRHRPGSDNRGIVLSLMLAGLGLAIALATAVTGVEPTRGLFYASLLATPFALLAALLLDPPDPPWRHRLFYMLGALLVIQIPITLVQAAQFGIGDPVRGTLMGSDVGAHVVGAVCLIGALWLVLSGRLTPLRATIAFGLAIVPVLSGANQVIFAFPLALLSLVVVNRRRMGLALVIVVGCLGALLALPGINSNYVRGSLSRATEVLKADPATEVASAMLADPAVALLGRGPATTVSHASFLTTEEENPLISGLGLEPATVPSDLGANLLAGSVERPKSSVLGVVGDLGLLGLLAYGVLCAYIVSLARRRHTPLAQVSTVGLTMLLILGYLNDWLEQPPFTLFLALLIGLALATAGDRDEAGPRST